MPSKFTTTCCLLAIALLAPSSASAQSVRVGIVLSRHKITPGPIHLPGGVPLRLTITNRSPEAHDFTAPEFFRHALVRSGPVPGGKLTLRPGGLTHVSLTPQRGTYKVRCTRFAHALLGESTTIIVH